MKKLILVLIVLSFITPSIPLAEGGFISHENHNIAMKHGKHVEKQSQEENCCQSHKCIAVSCSMATNLSTEHFDSHNFVFLRTAYFSANNLLPSSVFLEGIKRPPRNSSFT